MRKGKQRQRKGKGKEKEKKKQNNKEKEKEKLCGSPRFGLQVNGALVLFKTMPGPPAGGPSASLWGPWAPS